MIGNPLKTGWECSAEKKVIVSVNHHLVLVLAEMKEWVGGSDVAIKGRHYKLLWEAKRGDLP